MVAKVWVINWFADPHRLVGTLGFPHRSRYRLRNQEFTFFHCGKRVAIPGTRSYAGRINASWFNNERSRPEIACGCGNLLNGDVLDNHYNKSTHSHALLL